MTRRRKILWLIKGLGLGGAEKLLTLMLPHLDREHFDYEVAYFLPWKNALVPYLERGGVPTFCLGQRHAVDPMALYRAVQLLRARSPDVLHMHLPYAGIVGGLAARLAGVSSTVYTEHSEFSRMNRLTATVHGATCGWNDQVICVSDAVRQSVLANTTLKEDGPIRTIYTGVNWREIAAQRYNPQEVREEFGVPAEDALVVHVGNFTPPKGHSNLLRAAKLVLKERPATFLLVGDGPLRTDMQGLAQELGIQEKVVFAGSRSDAVRIIAAADLYVLPSQHEGLGLTLMEAMALGRPIVATRVGGIPEVVTDGVHGLLVDPHSPQELAHGILVVLGSPELQQRFRMNSLQRLEERFELGDMVRTTEALYDEVLAANGA